MTNTHRVLRLTHGGLADLWCVIVSKVPGLGPGRRGKRSTFPNERQNRSVLLRAIHIQAGRSELRRSIPVFIH